jgi:hypothetical protein
VNNPKSDVVTRQYERRRYPEPIQNLEAWLRNNWQWFELGTASDFEKFGRELLLSLWRRDFLAIALNPVQQTSVNH